MLRIFLTCIDDYTEDMATMSALAKIYSTVYMSAKSWAWQIFVQRRIFGYNII